MPRIASVERCRQPGPRRSPVLGYMHDNVSDRTFKLLNDASLHQPVAHPEQQPCFSHISGNTGPRTGPRTCFVRRHSNVPLCYSVTTVPFIETMRWSPQLARRVSWLGSLLIPCVALVTIAVSPRDSWSFLSTQLESEP